METLIFSVDITDATAKLGQIRVQVEDYKKQQRELSDEVKKGNEQAAQAYEVLGGAIRNLQGEQRNLTKQVDGYVAVQKKQTDQQQFQNNSIQQNRDLLKQLTAQYINLKNPSKDATNQIKQLSDTLKKQEQAIGDTRRNVGNYADALAGLPGGLGKAVTGVTGFNAALKANPIVAVVGLLVTLGTQLTKNEKIFEAGERIIAGFNGALQFVIDTVVTTISSFENLGKALTSPLQFFKDLATGAKDAAVASYEATEALQSIEDAERELAKSIALTNTEIEKQRNLQTSGKTLAERQKAAKEVIRLSEQVRDAELKFAKDRVTALEQLAAANAGNEDLAQQVSDAIVKREALLQNFYSSTRKAAKLSNEEIAKDISLLQQYNLTLQDLQKSAKEGFDVIQEGAKDLGDIVRPQVEAVAVAIDNIPTALEIATENFEGFQQGLQGSMDKIQEIVFIAQTSLDAISLASQVSIDNRIAQLNEQTEEEIANIERLGLEEEEKEKRILAVREKAAKKEEQLEKQAARNQKAIQTVQAGISGSLAILQSLANTTLPFPASLAAPIAIGALTAVQIAAINRQQFEQGGEVPLMEQGGAVEEMADGGRIIPIKGRSHRQGGENVKVGNRTVANIEGGEGMFIMKKTAFSSINKYSNINKAFGGKSWTGGTTKYAADGGQLNATLPASQANNSVNNQIEQANLMADAMRNIPAPELSLTELNKRQSIMSKSVRVSEL
jgi:hypothetical protein